MGKEESKRKIRQKTAELMRDVTLADCANNPRRVQQTKVKSGSKAIVLPGEPDEPHPLFDAEGSENELADDGGAASHNHKKSSLCSRDAVSCGIAYPSDIWFLIAKYIAPEDLCRFALICRDSSRVLGSVHFWRELCERFLKDKSSLPRDLQNPCDGRRGLRARVIRLLFLRRPALMQYVKPPATGRYEPYSLQGMRLLLTWHEKEDNNWNFFFKWVRQPASTVQQSPKHERRELFHNPESGYRILKVTCNQFIFFPYPQHFYLSTISVGLTSDMRGQKLSLGFSDYTTTHCTAHARQHLGRTHNVQNRVDLEPISRIVVMDWWHPEYPHSGFAYNHRDLVCSRSDDEEW